MIKSRLAIPLIAMVAALPLNAFASSPMRFQNIRQVDFKNMDYLPYAAMGEGSELSYRVRNGKVMRARHDGAFYVTDVQYGDLDRDGRQDAIVSTLDNTGGTGNFTLVIWFRLDRSGQLAGTTLDGGDRSAGGIADYKVLGNSVRVRTYFGDAACCENGMTVKNYTIRNGKAVELGARSLEPSIHQEIEELRFDRGTTSSTQRMDGSVGKYFGVRARAGQILTMSLSRPVRGAIFQVRSPNGNVISQVIGRSSVDVKLPSSGLYTIGAFAPEALSGEGDSGLPGNLTVRIR